MSKPVMSFETKPKDPNRQMSFSGSTFKLLKACSFCRKRKIKCKVLNNNICENCKEHNRECVFDHKIVSRENKVKKPKPSTKVNLTEAIANNTKHLSSYTGTFLDQIDSNAMEEFNKTVDATDFYKESMVSPFKWSPGMLQPSPQEQSPLTLTRSPENLIANSLKFGQKASQTNEDAYQLYIENIEPYTPFLSYDVFNQELDAFSLCCVHVAAISSTKNIIPEPSVHYLLVSLNGYFSSPIDWNPMRLACFFLLPSRTKVPRALIRQSLEAFNRFFNDDSYTLSTNLLAGALCVDAWLALFNETQLITDKSIIKRSSHIFDMVDIKSYNYQFLSVNVFLYQLIWLINDKSLSHDDKKYRILQFEFDMLLTPAKLSKNLIVVKDTLLSTPEAFLLHILHNMLMINYYTLMVQDVNFGEMTSISAVPGLYHFISGMAISNFRVTVELVNRWSIIADCQVYTAKLLLRLYNEMEFETFRFTLQFYTRRNNTNFDASEYIPVDDEVKQFLSSSQLKRDDDFDGAVVFWVFRDVRSMSLQLYINERKRRGSETSDRTL